MSLIEWKMPIHLSPKLTYFSQEQEDQFHCLLTRPISHRYKVLFPRLFPLEETLEKQVLYSFFTISTFSYLIRYTIVNITTIGNIKYFIFVKFERHVKKISKDLQVSVITV